MGRPAHLGGRLSLCAAARRQAGDGCCHLRVGWALRWIAARQLGAYLEPASSRTSPPAGPPLLVGYGISSPAHGPPPCPGLVRPRPGPFRLRRSQPLPGAVLSPRGAPRLGPTPHIPPIRWSQFFLSAFRTGPPASRPPASRCSRYDFRRMTTGPRLYGQNRRRSAAAPQRRGAFLIRRARQRATGRQLGRLPWKAAPSRPRRPSCIAFDPAAASARGHRTPEGAPRRPTVCAAAGLLARPCPATPGCRPAPPGLAQHLPLGCAFRLPPVPAPGFLRHPSLRTSHCPSLSPALRLGPHRHFNPWTASFDGVAGLRRPPSGPPPRHLPLRPPAARHARGAASGGPALRQPSRPLCLQTDRLRALRLDARPYVLTAACKPDGRRSDGRAPALFETHCPLAPGGAARRGPARPSRRPAT
jgi:hypothetical protein